MYQRFFSVQLAILLIWAAAARADEPPAEGAGMGGAGMGGGAAAGIGSGAGMYGGMGAWMGSSDEAERAERAGGYAIGLEAYGPQATQLAALRAHTDLPDDHGLLVKGVISKSPAEKAGIKAHDVLLTVNGKRLKDTEDLLSGINQSKGKKVVIEVSRDGKHESITVVPVKAGVAFVDFDGEETVRKWQEGMKRYQILRPGMILSNPSAAQSSDLPDDMTIMIKKEGARPMEVTVRRGNQAWGGSAMDLDKLPADVRVHVDRILHPVQTSYSYMFSGSKDSGGRTSRKATGGSGAGGGIVGGAYGTSRGGGVGRSVRSRGSIGSTSYRDFYSRTSPSKARSDDGLGTQIKEMSRRIEQLQKSIDEMRKELRQQKRPEDQTDAA